MTLALHPSGLFPSWAIMPRYVRWYTYLNPMRYSYAACIINAFEDRPTALIGPFTVRTDAPLAAILY